MPRPANLSPQQMRSAIPRLEARVRDVRDLDVQSITEGSDPKVLAIAAHITSTLSQIYGEDSHEFARLNEASHLNRTSYVTSFIGQGRSTSVEEERDGVNRGRNRAIALLEAETTSLREALQHEAPATAGPVRSASPGTGRPENTDIFVVHGHDGPAKTEVARVIERADLKAVILHEQANAGRTIIEKFEDHGGAVGFAVVVLTPDDFGGPSPDQLRPRARQNVIGELFWFAGKLGRKRVCALKKGDIEMPSDIAGVGYTEMDERGAWKTELLKELDVAGYTVDWQNALA
jgi:predicted nucleotide-binding protein